MDDMLFLADLPALRDARSRSESLLAGMGLRMKDGGVLNRCELGVSWLGFTLYPDRPGCDWKEVQNKPPTPDFHSNTAVLSVPEGQQILACSPTLPSAAIPRLLLGGEASLRAQPPDSVNKMDAPRRVRREHGETFPAHPPGRIPFVHLFRWFSLADSLHHRLVSAVPPGRILDLLPRHHPQQQQARPPEQEHRLPGLSGSRHDDFVSTDDAPSGAPLSGGNETTRKTPPPADIHEEKAGGGAATEDIRSAGALACEPTGGAPRLAKHCGRGRPAELPTGGAPVLLPEP